MNQPQTTRHKSQMNAVERLQAKQEAADEVRAKGPVNIIFARLRHPDITPDAFALLADVALKYLKE
jgi:hypothetical protein